MEQEGGIGVMAQLYHKSGEAEKQRSKEAEKQGNRNSKNSPPYIIGSISKKDPYCSECLEWFVLPQ